MENSPLSRILDQAGFQSLLASIVESSDDAIISKDLNGIVMTWNKGAERIFGYTAEEMIGQPISVIAAPDRLNEMPEILERVRRGERIEHYESVRKAKNGALVDISLSVSPIRDRNGKIVGAAKISRDITEKKRAERLLLTHAERLARSNADLQQFAYVASHDLQEPLRNISAFSELLERRYHGRLDEQADEFIENIVSSAKRMSSMIRDLLEYSLVSTSELSGPTVIDVRQAVDWALSNLEAAIRESGAQVTVGEMPTLNGDESGLPQLFQNLIGNAIKYRRPDVPVRIEVTAERRGAFWLFSIADNGLGMDPEYADRIFGLFKRLHGNTYPGTGIGLALCRKIVERHGGRIWVKSEPGKGSIFYFTLPFE